MCLSFYRKKPEELLYLQKISVLADDCCPHCQQRDAVCYYDIVENGMYRYEFICLNCSGIFTLLLSASEYSKRSNAKTIHILSKIMSLTADTALQKNLAKCIAAYEQQTKQDNPPEK